MKDFVHLPQPVAIKDQVWPDGTLPFLTVRTMAYNQENYIKDCVEGILMQKTTFPVQVLIHDDASTDKTREILKEYQDLHPNLLQVYFQKENSYRHKQKPLMRKPFMDLIAGKYIALCEGDDYWTDPNKLQKQIDFLENNQDYSLTYHDWVYKEGDEFYPHLNTFPATLTRVHRNVIPKDFVYPRVLNGDTVLQFLLAQHGKSKFIEGIKPAVKRKDSGGIWNSLSTCKQNLSKFETNEVMIDFFKDTYDIKELVSKRSTLYAKILSSCNESYFSFKKKSFFRNEILRRSLLKSYFVFVAKSILLKLLRKK